MYMVLGPYRVCVNCNNIDAVDAVVYREIESKKNEKKSKEYSFEIILENSGERVSVDGFDSFAEANKERDCLLRKGMLVDLDDEEEDEKDEVKVIDKRPTIEKNWELEKREIVEDKGATIIPLIPEKAGESIYEENVSELNKLLSDVPYVEEKNDEQNPLVTS